MDHTTSLPIRVSTDGTTGPYIRLPYSQLEEVKRILDRHGILYAVKENIVSMSGGPFIAVVNLGRGADANAIQRILDGMH